MISEEYLLTLMQIRHSGREYDSTKILSQKQIDSLIEAIRLTPSCFGEEPWRYIICNKRNNNYSWENLFDCLDLSNQKWAKNAQVLIISLGAKNFCRIDKGENFWSAHDTGAANYALMLQAAAIGLMAHQMGGFDSDRVVEKFKITNDLNIMSIIAVGYEKEGNQIGEKKRRPIEEIFFYNELPEKNLF